MDTDIEISSDDIVYTISKTENHWYVTRISDCYRNGGQNAVEYEHYLPFYTDYEAVNWAHKDLKEILKGKE
ncbi:hypothetical protein UFOVP587_32 [uncultured Caudovirales phage]|uniref:Uncharacterized protein n=1 Tax=uncultured Caudovirales phage TaxID=2100421 RepID=A0A6J5N323_9CAUD|nr:hypothetical protein UFOVP587_32 [uncultured Caudovirales phage]